MEVQDENGGEDVSLFLEHFEHIHGRVYLAFLVKN